MCLSLLLFVLVDVDVDVDCLEMTTQLLKSLVKGTTAIGVW